MYPVKNKEFVKIRLTFEIIKKHTCPVTNIRPSGVFLTPDFRRILRCAARVLF